ncbi:unnamed protein product [Closterium sp. NIES-53]
MRPLRGPFTAPSRPLSGPASSPPGCCPCLIATPLRDPRAAPASSRHPCGIRAPPPPRHNAPSGPARRGSYASRRTNGTRASPPARRDAPAGPARRPCLVATVAALPRPAAAAVAALPRPAAAAVAALPRPAAAAVAALPSHAAAAVAALPHPAAAAVEALPGLAAAAAELPAAVEAPPFSSCRGALALQWWRPCRCRRRTPALLATSEHCPARAAIAATAVPAAPAATVLSTATAAPGWHASWGCRGGRAATATTPATATTAATTALAARGGGRMQLQRRPRKSLTPQQLREWYASWGCRGGRGGCRPGVGSSGASGSGQVQLQRRPREALSPQQLCEWYAQSRGSLSTASCLYVTRTGVRTGQPCGTPGHTESCCFARLSDAWRTEFGDDAELPSWLELLRQRVDIFALDYEAILTAMYALSTSAEAAGGTARAAGGAAGTGGAAGAGAAGGAGGAASAGASGAARGAAGTGDPGAEGTGSVSAISRGVARPQPYYVPLLQQVLGSPPSPGPPPPFLSPPPVQSQSQLQPASPLPGPSPYSGPTRGLTERREPESRPVSPESRSTSPVRTVCTICVSRPRPPPVPGTHSMSLRPSTAPQRVPLLSHPASSLPTGPDPASDSLRASSLAVTRFLATAVTDPSFESTAASALVTELVEFAAACRLDYTTSLVTESASASVCPPSVGGECTLGTDVLEDRQEEFECFAASVPHLVSMLIAPEGDPDAPDIPTPRSYAEAIEGPYSSQWQAAMDAEMASWKSTGTYVDEFPPPGANIVSGMWIFRVKRPPGSPPVFKARYVARGFSQRQGVDFF